MTFPESVKRHFILQGLNELAVAVEEKSTKEEKEAKEQEAEGAKGSKRVRGKVGDPVLLWIHRPFKCSEGIREKARERNES